MKTPQHKRIHFVMATLVILLIAATSVWAKKGGKLPGEGHRYSVTVTETTAFPVFWGDDDQITGRIADAQAETLLVNRGMVGGIDPYVNMYNLFNYPEALPPCSEDPDWFDCFFPGGVIPGQVTGTLQISSSGTPRLHLSFMGLGRNGKSLWYVFTAEAATTGSWDLYHMEVDDSVDMMLLEWEVAVGNGPLSKGCVGCGDFNQQVTVTVTRESNTYLPPEE